MPRCFFSPVGFPIVALALAGCSGSEPAAEEVHVVHWSYEGEGAPDNWADLDVDFAACRAGGEQSPIEIPTDTPVNADHLEFDYQETAVNILNNGHTVQVNYAEGSSVTIDGETYDLLQLHFHGPSEHTLAGSHTALEMHLVHANADGGLAVVGVMIAEGDEHAAYAPVFGNLPAEVSEATVIAGAVVNAVDLLPADRSYYRYDGSLTTPPCSEGVKWHVLRQTVTLSADQIAAFTDIIEDDNRPVQSLNEREFVMIEGAS